MRLESSTSWSSSSMGGNIFARCSTDNALEVFDKMSLVEVAEVQCELRPVDRFAFGETVDGFVESMAIDHPFRADADIAGEQSLERSHAEAALSGCYFNPRDRPIGRDLFDDVSDFLGHRITLRSLLPQKIFRDRNHGSLASLREHTRYERFAIGTEHIMEWDKTIGEAGHRRSHERVESAGAEFDAEDFPLALDHARESAFDNSIDTGATVLEGDVDRGVRQGLLRLSLETPQVPGDDPIVPDKGR